MKTEVRVMPVSIRRLVVVLICVMGLHSLSPMSFGRPVPSMPIATDSVRAQDLTAIQQILEQKVVQHRLQEMGFTKEEVELRLARVSDAELHELAVQSEALMAGGDGGGSVIFVLLVVLLVLLILRIADNSSRVESDLLAA